jgi:hypothetical protein
VTLEFSTDTPCVAAVIPAMDKMHTELTAAADNVDYSPALQAALSLGKTLLDKYYSLTDDSEVYRIAMGMYILVDLRLVANLLLLLYLLSPASKTQTQVFQKAELGRELGQNSRRDCSGGIQEKL